MNKQLMVVAILLGFTTWSWTAEGKEQMKEFIYKPEVGWHKTGIIVKEGQKIKIKANGSWSPDAGKMKLTASGIMEDRWIQYSIVPKIAHGRLIAYISDKPEEYYNIGGSKTFKSKSSGELIIGVNDKDKSNNQGELEIKIIY